MGHARTPHADSDLDAIWHYIATKSESLGVAVSSQSHPTIGRARDEDLRPGLRSFPVGEYVIVYQPVSKVLAG